jgi:hypothetical protein
MTKVTMPVAIVFALADVSKKLSEGGAVLGGLGALLIMWAAVTILTANRTSHEGVTEDITRRQHILTAIGAFLIALAFALQLISLTSKSTPAPVRTPTGGIVTSPPAT